MNRKFLSLFIGVIIPFIVSWLLGVIAQLIFMAGGPKGISYYLMGAVAITISFIFSYYLSKKFQETFLQKFLILGNVITFILWLLLLLLAF